MAQDGKGDYKVVIDQESEPALAPSRQGSFASQGGLGGTRSPALGAPSSVDSLLNHPALPVLCYCASSILMT
ncbi:hypothetical protein JCM10213_009328, partial [Rhodosporidiobolus nylandii]